MNSHLNKINIKGVDHIQFDVANIEESQDFYTSVFGFSIKELGLRACTRWMIIGVDQVLYLCMHEFPEGRDIKNEGLEITHFGILVEDFDSVLYQLREHGVTTTPNHEVQYHSSRSVYFIDPNGYKIEISEKYGGGIENAE